MEAASRPTLSLAFSFERETKNAVRYQEQHPIDAEPKIGSLYVRKAALAQLGRWSLEKPYPLDLRVVRRDCSGAMRKWRST